jgi:putative ABC transport system permease protein
MSIRRFVQREKKDADLAEEIESHLAHEQDLNAARVSLRKKLTVRPT